MEGKKFSSSRGVVIYVKDFLERYQTDALRYYIISAGPETQDSDFTWEDFLQRTNSELVAGWGNLVNRSAAMIAKNFGEIPDATLSEEIDIKLLENIESGFEVVGHLIEKHRQKNALSEIMRLVGLVNAYISITEPFKLKGDVLGSEEKTRQRLGEILYTLASAVVDLNTMFSVFLPHSSAVIYEIFGGGSGIDEGNGPQEIAPMPKIVEVKDLDDETRGYPIITGDYELGKSILKWGHHKVVPHTEIEKPTPVFVKLDESIVQEELNRMTGVTL
jgi:methionyl-tRNA synthetase